MPSPPITLRSTPLIGAVSESSQAATIAKSGSSLPMNAALVNDIASYTTLADTFVGTSVPTPPPPEAFELDGMPAPAKALPIELNNDTFSLSNPMPAALITPAAVAGTTTQPTDTGSRPSADSKSQTLALAGVKALGAMAIGAVQALFFGAPFLLATAVDTLVGFAETGVVGYVLNSESPRAQKIREFMTQRARERHKNDPEYNASTTAEKLITPLSGIITAAFGVADGMLLGKLFHKKDAPKQTYKEIEATLKASKGLSRFKPMLRLAGHRLEHAVEDLAVTKLIKSNPLLKTGLTAATVFGFSLGMGLLEGVISQKVQKKLKPEDPEEVSE